MSKATRSRADLESVWRFCTGNRELLGRSEAAGCFHCASIYPPALVEEWVDEPPAVNSGNVVPEGVTALCPRCGIDAVLPSARVEISPALLEQMAEHFFGGVFRLSDTG